MYMKIIVRSIAARAIMIRQSDASFDTYDKFVKKILIYVGLARFSSRVQILDVDVDFEILAIVHFAYSQSAVSFVFKF